MIVTDPQKPQQKARILVEQNGNVTVVYFQDQGILDEGNIQRISQELFEMVDNRVNIKLLLNF